MSVAYIRVMTIDRYTRTSKYRYVLVPVLISIPVLSIIRDIAQEKKVFFVLMFSKSWNIN